MAIRRKGFWTHRVFFQGVNQQGLPKYRLTIFSHFGLLLQTEAYTWGEGYSSQDNRHIYWQVINREDAHESTWFSNDRMTGKDEVLKAHSAMASITSWKIWNMTGHQGESSRNLQAKRSLTEKKKMQLLMDFHWHLFLMLWQRMNTEGAWTCGWGF